MGGVFVSQDAKLVIGFREQTIFEMRATRGATPCGYSN
jgi:hypothetical protein